MTTCARRSQHQYVALVELQFKRRRVQNVACMTRGFVIASESSLLDGAAWSQWTAAARRL